VVAIAEPEAETGVEVDEAPVPAQSRVDLAGEWVEDWPMRGGCADHVSIRASGRGFDLSGADCNDGEPYRYSDVSLEGRTPDSSCTSSRRTGC
jgi:hypothetical protein